MINNKKINTRILALILVCITLVACLCSCTGCDGCTGGEMDPELRQKIEQARERIAAQVAQNNAAQAQD